jgi:hypothetical protein
VRRRDLLSVTGIGIATLLAGCSGSGGDDGNSGGDGGGGSGSDGGSGDGGSGGGGSGGDTTKSLSLGESFTNPIGNTLTVHDVELKDSVEHASRYTDEMVTKEAADGEQWALATLEVRNDSGQKQYLTPLFEVVLLANGTEYTNTAINSDGEAYSPAEVEDGGSDEGWVAYGIPADLPLDDVEIVHSNSADGESWTVTWSA